jgi:hypothetical protein
MIDIETVNKPIDYEQYNFVSSVKEYPILFLGFVIKNQYDNLRVNLQEKYDPINLLHFSKDKQSVTALKGIKLVPNASVKKLYNAIKMQEQLVMNLMVYENLLNQYGFACKETYGLYAPGMYPIDFNNLKSICDNDFNSDKKIFQHLLGLDEKTFDFQKFSSLKLFILTV